MENILNPTVATFDNSPIQSLRSMKVENRRLVVALARAIMDYSIPLNESREPLESFRDANLGEALETAITLVTELDLKTVETALVLIEDGFEGSAKQLIHVAVMLSL